MTAENKFQKIERWKSKTKSEQIIHKSGGEERSNFRFSLFVDFVSNTSCRKPHPTFLKV